MRILEFTVRKQRLLRKINCDFSGLVAGSVGYLHVKFEFPYGGWDDYPIKIASFRADGKEPAMPLDEHNMCLIPPEVLCGEEFSVCLIGANKNGRIDTNEIYIQQEVNTNGNRK